ncbi:MAG TPA: ABC transporter ATP-binding protein [Beutenbergiaceae bacterium]|nr:ABC transporter ATP-binding protein [Beutenbergiaceae bacterium]
MIEFHNVTKTYGATTAVEKFSLQIPPGKTTVFVGSSGCGKTTLLRMINRMVDPTDGYITIDGEDIAHQKPVNLRRRIGYVMQSSGLLPHQTVAANVATVPMLQGTSKNEAYGHVPRLLHKVGLDPDLVNRYPGQLSGGQAQRVGVARALAADPNILLMDEPFGAVDPIVRADLQTELLRLQQHIGKTIVFVTHDVEEAFLLGDQVVILREGAQVAQAGSPSSIIESPANSFVSQFVGLGNGSREFHLKNTPTGTVVVDHLGRTHGTLTQ